MFHKFIAWWVRNAAHIGPIASCVSAMASLLSVRMIIKTFRQARADRREEIEAKHPRFVLGLGEVEWVTSVGNDQTITPFYQLVVNVKNVKEHSAKHLHLVG